MTRLGFTDSRRRGPTWLLRSNEANGRAVFEPQFDGVGAGPHSTERMTPGRRPRYDLRVRAAVVNSFFSPRGRKRSHERRAGAARGRGRQRRAGRDGRVSATPPRRKNATVCGSCDFQASRSTSKIAFNYDIPFTATPRNARRLFRLLDEFEPDVVHQHGQFFDLTWMSSLWARRRNVPTVLTVHTRFQSPFRMHAAAMRVADSLVVRPFVRLGAPYVVPVDVFVREYVIARFGIRWDRMVDIPVGVEAARFRCADRRLMRRRLGIGDRPMILSVGHVIPLRDRLALVEAMPALLATFPDLVVVVVGRIYDDRFVRRAGARGRTRVDHHRRGPEGRRSAVRGRRRCRGPRSTRARIWHCERRDAGRGRSGRLGRPRRQLSDRALRRR